MAKGKAGGDSGRLQTGYNQGYNAAAEGKDVPAMLAGQESDLASSMITGWKDYEPPSSTPEFKFEMPDFEIPDYSKMYEEQKVDTARIAGEAEVNNMYRSKFSAANSAIDRVTSTIKEEMGYAKVSGADYTVDPSQKKERINNMFASLWSEDQEKQLSALEGKWGAGENRWTSGIVRGVASEEAAAEGEEVSAGRKVPVLGGLADEDEEKLGGVTALLGA